MLSSENFINSYDHNVDSFGLDNNILYACPGFCGRTQALSNGSSSFIASGSFTDCQACPWGTRSEKNSPLNLCHKCSTPLRAYDYCFLVFHALIPLLINALFIKLYSTRRKASQRERLWLLAQIVCAFLETSLALISSLLLVSPIGSLKLDGCLSHGLQEWYPMLHNPVVNYTKTLRCSYELVYPLYSLPFINLAMCLANLLIFRSFLYIFACRTGTRLPAGAFYASLWVLPLTAFFHAFLSGVLYYAFPHLCVITSLGLNAIHLAMEGRKKIGEMFCMVACFKGGEHLALVIVHMSLFGFGIASIGLAGPGDASLSGSYILMLVICLPAPTIFYILTIRLTTPIRTVRYRHR